MKYHCNKLLGKQKLISVIENKTAKLLFTQLFPTHNQCNICNVPRGSVLNQGDRDTVFVNTQCFEMRLIHYVHA